jgi:predicted transposase YdaD
MESIIQDPSVQELIREWEDKGRAEGIVEGRAEGIVEGRAEGCALEARVLLRRLLAARSISITPDVRARIDAESDVARLESWVLSAATADTVGDVFGGS